MVVEIKKYQPVLDAALPVVSEFVRGNKARIVTSTHPVAIGLALDLDGLLEKFYRFFDTKVVLKQCGVEKTLDFMKRDEDERIEHKTLEFVFDENLDFDSDSGGYYLCRTFLEENSTEVGRKLSISANNVGKPSYERTLNKRIRKRFALQKPVQKIKLDFSYASLSPFPFNTFYQDFEDLGEFEKPRAGRMGINYPVSSFDSHRINLDVWKFFQLPVYWNWRSQCASTALHILVGDTTIEKLSDKHKQYPIRLGGSIKKGEDFCYRLIDYKLVFVDGYKKGREWLKPLCEEFNCPPYLHGFFLNKILNTYKFFINQKNLEVKNPKTMMIIEAYCKDRMLKGIPKSFNRVYEAILASEKEEERQRKDFKSSLQEDYRVKKEMGL